ncbi:hypothetical protein K8S19_11360 [bacterium]|nr:hypothetical protein [bacterium]
MKKGFIRLSILGLVLFLLSGCVTLGKPFPGSFAETIVIGQTLRTEIEAKLGEPYRTGLDSGDRTATYLHYQFGLFAQTTTVDLTIVYTSENIVKSYVFNSNQSWTQE